MASRWHPSRRNAARARRDERRWPRAVASHARAPPSARVPPPRASWERRRAPPREWKGRATAGDAPPPVRARRQICCPAALAALPACSRQRPIARRRARNRRAARGGVCRARRSTRVGRADDTASVPMAPLTPAVARDEAAAEAGGRRGGDELSLSSRKRKRLQRAEGAAARHGRPSARDAPCGTRIPARRRRRPLLQGGQLRGCLAPRQPHGNLAERPLITRHVTRSRFVQTARKARAQAERTRARHAEGDARARPRPTDEATPRQRHRANDAESAGRRE